MALADENQVRETRFTRDVFELAAGRFDVVSRTMTERHGAAESPAVGAAVLEDLGWAPIMVEEYAEGMLEQLRDAFGLDPDDEAVADALRVAVVHTLQMGALLSDVTYERSMGLV